MKSIFIITFSFLSLLAKDYPTAYASCIGCHGLKGERNSQSPSSKPNSLSKSEIIKALQGYQTGSLNKYGRGSMMKPFAQRLTQSQIVEIADYLIKK